MYIIYRNQCQFDHIAISQRMQNPPLFSCMLFLCRYHISRARSRYKACRWNWFRILFIEYHSIYILTYVWHSFISVDVPFVFETSAKNSNSNESIMLHFLYVKRVFNLVITLVSYPCRRQTLPYLTVLRIG